MSTIEFDITDGIALIAINRPERRNAIDRPTADAIRDTVDEIETRDEVAVVILTGNGGFFSAGMDLKAAADGGERPVNERGFGGIAGRPPSTPVIAAVEGHALGGGFELALACDVIVAAEDAVFGLPEVKRGLIAAGGGVLRLPRKIPQSIAMEAAITGEPFSAHRAAELGLVNRVVPSGGALAAARELAAHVAANAPLAVKASKQLIVESADWLTREFFDRQMPIVAPVRDSLDAREGIQAFKKKRAPVWQGR